LGNTKQKGSQYASRGFYGGNKYDSMSATYRVGLNGRHGGQDSGDVEDVIISQSEGASITVPSRDGYWAAGHMSWRGIRVVGEIRRWNHMNAWTWD
jgi:hypothetical protein